jgi:hypothetical protein
MTRPFYVRFFLYRKIFWDIIMCMVKYMRNISKTVICSGMIILALAGAARAQSSGHYLAGSCGMNSAALSQVKEHGVKTLTGLYYSTKYARDDGSEIDVKGNLDVFFQTAEYQFLTGGRFLGGNYGFAFNFFLAEADYNISNPDIQEGPVGVGDPEVAPLILGWESGLVHWMFKYSFFVPLGRYDEDAVDNVGKGHWSHLFSVGGTGYTGADSTWSGTLIARYEINSNIDDRDIKPGDNMIVEAAFGKRMWEMLDIGAVGYGVWQVTDISGSGVSPEDQGEKSSIMAAGPEIVLMVPDKPLAIKWRGYAQFAARNRFRGYESIIELLFSF